MWTNEDGVRFQPAMKGSGVYCGVLALPDVLATKDEQGVAVADETAAHGSDKRCPPGFQQVKRYVEMHIGQGPILELEDKTIGVVTGGQGIRWFDATLTGAETHAGPVPMRNRRDPVPALASVIDLIYQIGRKDEHACATIGKKSTRVRGQ